MDRRREGTLSASNKLALTRPSAKLVPTPLSCFTDTKGFRTFTRFRGTPVAIRSNGHEDVFIHLAVLRGCRGMWLCPEKAVHGAFNATADQYREFKRGRTVLYNLRAMPSFALCPSYCVEVPAKRPVFEGV